MVKIIPVVQGVHLQVVDVQASASDTKVVVSHTLGVAPGLVSLVPLTEEFYASRWRVTDVSSTVVTLTKDSARDSGTPMPQVRVQMQRLHSMIA